MYDNLLYIHENNILTKINNNYNKIGFLIKEFYQNEYLPMRSVILKMKFDEQNVHNFEIATALLNDYYKKLVNFRITNGISSQSKWDSTFLEEISSYLFKDLTEIVSNEYGIFNKKIFAGLKINANKEVETITKDVDFCIGKKVQITIDKNNYVIILPVIAVEVKTYLDATMFGEIKSSSKSIRSASPNSKTYVLIGYKNIANEHLIAARQDSVLSEIFVLQARENDPFHYLTLYEYWKEISNAISSSYNENFIPVPGKILHP